MKTSFNFPCFLFIILALLVGSCKEMKLDIQESQDRLDVLEGTTIPTINEQIAAIDSSILDLQEMDKTLDSYIKSLESTAADLQKQIGENKTEVELELDLAIISKTLAELKLADLALEKKVADLQAYVDTELAPAKDWAEATFSTLTQYEQTQTEISAIKASIEQVNADLAALDSRLDGKIEARTTELLSAIAASESNLKTWVGEQLAQSYYDIATLNGILSALSARLDEADTDLQKQINEQKEALQTAKADFTKEYKQYVEQAIASGGIIDQAIATQVKKAQDNLQEKIDKISNSIDELEGRISKLENDFVNRIQSLKYVPEFSDRVALMSDYCKSVSVDFLITPVSQAAVLAESWAKESSIIKAFLRYTKVLETRAVSPAIPLVVTSVSSNEEGLLSVTVGENPSYPLNAEFLNGEVPAVLYLHISDGNTEILSDLVDVKTFVEEKLDLSSIMSANSYIVSKAGAYKFKAVQGNSETSVGAVASADVLWETFGTDVAPAVGDLVKYVSCEDGYISFQTAATFKEGNAVIAAKDANGNILWSWHIWLTRKPQGQVYYNSAGTMMDRNLGATSATPGDVGALGLLYQWGRKDPFLGSSSISSNTLAKSTTTWPSYVTSTSSTGTIDYATKNPTTFIKRNDSNNDWYYTGSEDTDNTRWTTSEKAKSIYDPCPPGWRVPDGRGNGVWAKALGSSLEFSCSISMGKGIEFSGKFGSGYTIWYPASGGRSNNDGSLGNVGYHGRYWSASPGSDCRACLLYFDDRGSVSPSYISLRANGQSVRCCRSGANGGAPVELTERANSFVVKSGSYVAFTPCMGNSEANAEMTAAGLVWQDTKSLVESVEAKDGKVVVKLSNKEGNAVVCSIDENNDTTWSWTLWVTDAIISDVTVNDSLTVMDRNIGALSADAMDETSIGNVYQWGRKDAWPGAGYGTFLRRMYDINNNEITRGHELLADDCKNNVAGAIAAPNTVFYRKYVSGTTQKGNYSWVTNDYSAPEIANADSLWNNDFKSMYDPCPAGYQVAYSYTARDIAAENTAGRMAATMLIDNTYVAPETMTDSWSETYYTRYSKQVQFRGGMYANLKFMVTGEITHEMKFSTNTTVGGLSPKAVYWTAKLDPNFKTSASYLRAVAMYQTASGSGTGEAATLKMNAISTSYLNLAYQLPVRCVRERK